MCVRALGFRHPFNFSSTVVLEGVGDIARFVMAAGQGSASIGRSAKFVYFVCEVESKHWAAKPLQV